MTRHSLLTSAQVLEPRYAFLSSSKVYQYPSILNKDRTKCQNILTRYISFGEMYHEHWLQLAPLERTFHIVYHIHEKPEILVQSLWLSIEYANHKEYIKCVFRL